MTSIKFRSQCLLYIFLIHALFFSVKAHSTFYQADTMAQYCQEYINFIALEESVNQLEAGICSGYAASAIEIMDLSGRLCKKADLNLDAVVKLYVDNVNEHNDLKNQSATYVMIELLQDNYSCEK